MRSTGRKFIQEFEKPYVFVIKTKQARCIAVEFITPPH